MLIFNKKSLFEHTKNAPVFLVESLAEWDQTKRPVITILHTFLPVFLYKPSEYD